MVESARLVNLIETEYKTLGLVDASFAKHASEKLGFEVVTSCVQKRRNELGIPTLSQTMSMGLLFPQERMEALEKLLNEHRIELQSLSAAILNLRTRLKKLEPEDR